MVKNCCVAGCRSESYRNCGINFFKFPKSEQLKQLWINVVPGNVKNYSVVCHLHFRPEDILMTLSRPRLTSDVVPSIFPVSMKSFKTSNAIVLKNSDPAVNRVKPNTLTETEDEDDDSSKSSTLPVLNYQSTPEYQPSEKMCHYVKCQNSGAEIKKLKRNIKILKQRLKWRDQKIKELKSTLIIIKDKCAEQNREVVFFKV